MIADTTRPARAHDCLGCGRTYLTTASLRDACCPDCGSGDYETTPIVPTWLPSFNPEPNSDGYRLHAIDLGRIGGYAESLPDMPLPHEIDMSNAAAEARRRAWPGHDAPRGVDDEVRG